MSQSEATDLTLMKYSANVLLANSRITVLISDYGQNKYLKLEQALLSNGVKYEIKKNLIWNDAGSVESRKKSPQKRMTDFERCDTALYCKTLYQGKIYQCARSAGLYSLGICNDKEGYLDIRNPQLSEADIKSFWLKKDTEACDHCDFTDHWRQIPPAIQVGR